jgi:cytidylate kinase
MQTIYIISGPLGVGKSTISKELCKTLDRAELIEGDVFLNKTENSNLLWEQRLEDAWQKVVDATNVTLTKGSDVVIDFVVEDELKWFCSQFTSLNIQIKYIVLIADKETIIKRLKKRHELKYKERSFALLDQLTKDTSNKIHLYDTTEKSSAEIIQEFINSPNFIQNLPKVDPAR